MGLVQLSEHDNGRRVSAHVGDEIVVRLPENATTGYQWTVNSYSDDYLSFEGRNGADAPVGPPGAGGSDAAFRFIATSEGEATIELKLWRGFEPDDARLHRFTATILIAP
jgi:inhibitor of cysteine peptidase